MARRLVILVFGVMAAGAAVNAGAWLADAISAGGTHRAATAVAMVLRAIVAVAFLAFVIVRAPARRRVREPRAFAACAAAMGALVAMRPPSASSASELILIGDGVALAGCVVVLVSALSLGRCFGVLPEARGLVTRGPYGIVRHPVYLGELTAAAGLLVAALSPLNLVLGAAIFVAQTVRMQLEERELAFTFPEYAVYAEQTPRLFPWVRPAARAVPTTLTTGELR